MNIDLNNIEINILDPVIEQAIIRNVKATDLQEIPKSSYDIIKDKMIEAVSNFFYMNKKLYTIITKNNKYYIKEINII